MAPLKVLASLLVALPFGAAVATGVVAGADQPRPAFRFADPAIVESSGLAVVDDLVVTVNDSGDEARVFSIDPASGETVGVTRWNAEAIDIEGIAPGADGSVWVGDIGDNAAARDTITVTRVPVGVGDRTVDATTYRLRYPDGASDAEALLAHPETGRLYVVTKGVFGGVVHVAPARLREDQVNLLRPVARTMSIVTDGAFLPDGDHVVLRDYSRAVVYETTAWESVGEVALPEQRQGEGIAAAGAGRILVSSEGQHAPVYDVALPPVASTDRATPDEQPTLRSREGQELPEEAPRDRDAGPWLIGVGVAVVAVVVLLRALRPR